MQLPNLYLPKVNLNGANFTKTNLDGADLQDSSLNKAKFDWARFKSTIFVANENFNDYPSQGNNDWLGFFTFPFNKQQVKCDSPKFLQAIQFYQSLVRDTIIEEENNILSIKDYPPDPNSEHEQKTVTFSTQPGYKEYKTCFSHLNLENLYFGKTDFREFNLSGTSFKNSYLVDADLRGANLVGTNLEGAYLKNIKIDNKDEEKLDEKTKLVIKLFNSSDPSEVIISELKKNKGLIDLTNLDLSTIKISGKTAQEKKELKGLDLEKTRLIKSTLENLDMGCGNSQGECKAADLGDVDLRGATLTNINLTGANLRSALLMKVTMEHVILHNADLFTAKLTSAVIKDTDFKNADLNSVTLKGATLENGDSSFADFSSVILSGATLNRVNLSNAKLNNADLSGATLNHVDLSKAKLNGAILYGADLSNAKNLDKVTSFKDASYCDKSSNNNDTSPITKFPKKFNPKDKGMVVSCQPPKS